MSKLLSFLFVLTISVNLVFAQIPTPADDKDVVKITTTLIQIDVTVTDKNGKQVTDLKPEDFEILENNEKQEITNFSYIAAGPEEKTETTETPKTNDKLMPQPPTKLKPENVRRTIALVVDDLGLSFGSMFAVKHALKKFVDETMQPTDLVAIIRTGSGIGALQQFTNNKQQLYAAIEKVKFNPAGRSETSTFIPIRPSLLRELSGGELSESDLRKEEQDFNLAETQREFFTSGTLGAVNYVIKGMNRLPGRKSIMLFSEGFASVRRDNSGKITEFNTRTLDAVQLITETANRAGVVLNTIDPRGVTPVGFTAEDDLNGSSFDDLNRSFNARWNSVLDGQQSLQYLAWETGGRAFINNNNIVGAVKKVINDLNGYYLIGYQPDSDTFDAKTRRFNKLDVRVKRPGLKVRFRNGFFGLTDESLNKSGTIENPREKLVEAAISPFTSNEIEVRISSAYYDDAKEGAQIRSFMYILGKDLKFADVPDDKDAKKIEFEIVAYTFGENGIPVDEVNRKVTISVRGESLKMLSERGVIFPLNVPVKKPGAYQFRVALRDVNSEKIGSASQFIQVPNLKKRQLALSGLILKNFTPLQWQKVIKGQPLNPTISEERTTDINSDTALRRFRKGTVLSYGLIVYNAVLDSSKKPNLETKVRLFHDNQIILDDVARPFDVAGQVDLKRIEVNGAVALGNKLVAGDYILQLIVIDKLAKGNNQVTSQFIEFEIVE